ncbi:hypothetical protein LWI28_024204 [Acer negundo]|uniref:Ubiquitin-like protease family profile domain-containing protein n=1 Tax=Acer negundo TaxID=4023 RepID=A0AAD5JU79_ACENE|nr:hypothetical protein LWI28_024204 [Acer negundo]
MIVAAEEKLNFNMVGVDTNRVALAIPTTVPPTPISANQNPLVVDKPPPRRRRPLANYLNEKRTRRFLLRPHRLVGRFWLQSLHPAAPRNRPPPSIRLLPATSRSDCGIFALKFLEYLWAGKPFDFEAKDGAALRVKIAT